MGDLNDLITIIPQIMLMFIPGYIALRIEELYRSKKRHDHYDTTAYALLYSALVKMMYSVAKFAIGKAPHIWKIVQENELIKEELKLGVYFMLAAFLGYLLVKLPSSSVGKRISKCYNKKLVSYETVWEKALENYQNGAWAQVYLKNGMMYTGKLVNYSANPNDSLREIMLTDCTMSIVKDMKNVNTSSDFQIAIKGEDQVIDRVLLNANDIISIEIIK